MISIPTKGSSSSSICSIVNMVWACLSVGGSVGVTKMYTLIIMISNWEIVFFLTLDVISSYPQFIKCHVRFTTVAIRPVWMKYPTFSFVKFSILQSCFLINGTDRFALRQQRKHGQKNDGFKGIIVNRPNHYFTGGFT